MTGGQGRGNVPGGEVRPETTRFSGTEDQSSGRRWESMGMSEVKGR